MSTVYTAADIEEIARSGSSVLQIGPGELISPAAIDAAASHGIELRRPGDGISLPEQSSERDSVDCTCDVVDPVATMLRDVVQSVIAKHPGADAATVTTEALSALGVGGADVGTPQQAQPAGQRIFPTKAKGARPVFFDDEGEMDAVVSIVTNLAAEVWSSRERIDTLERLLTSKGTLPNGAVDSYRPDEDARTERSRESSDYVSRVYRVFDEMREQVVAGETRNEYMAVIRRAFDQLPREVPHD